MQTRQLMEIIYVLCTLYYALQPMLLEVLCLSCVSEMPRLKELPRLNKSSMHNLATGTFIFCHALEGILSSSSSDPGVAHLKQ